MIKCHSLPNCPRFLQSYTFPDRTMHIYADATDQRTQTAPNSTMTNNFPMP